MLRRLCTAEKWSRLSLLNLREELAKRGLKRTGSKEEMMKRLEDNEAVESLVGMPEKEEDLGKASLNSLTKPFLMREILKARPEFAGQARLSKKEMLECLSTTLVEDKGPGQKDLRTLLLKTASGIDQASLTDIFVVLNELKDPYQVSQLDINVLLNTEATCLAPVWAVIIDNVDQLSYSQVSIFLHSVNTVQDFFKKRWAEGERLPSSAIEKALMRTAKLSKDLSALDIAKLLTAVKTLLRDNQLAIIPQLQQQMLEKVKEVEIPSPDVIFILENLPIGCYKTNQAAIDSLLKTCYQFLPKLSSDKVISTLFGIYNAGGEVTFNLIYHLDAVPREFFKKLSPTTLYQLSKILSEKRMLSEDIGKTIIEVLALHNLSDKPGISLYVDTIYAMHINDSFVQISNRSRLLSKCLLHESNLTLEALLKLGICYLPHMSKEDLYTKVLMDLSSYDPDDQIFAIYIPLIKELQSKLLHTATELPIFNYQFHSFELLTFNAKEHLCNTIHKILLHHSPSDPLVYKFFNSIMTQNPPPIAIFSIQPNQLNVLEYSKALWKHHQKFDTQELKNLVQAAIPVAAEMKLQGTEALFYLTSISSEAPIDLSDFQASEYYFALCYNLKQRPEVPTSSLLTNTDLQSLFGPALLKTIITLKSLSPELNIKYLSSNLNYSPRSQPKISQELLQEFINSIIHSNSEINHYAFSTFILHNFDLLSKTDRLSVFAFLKADWDQVNPTLKGVIEKSINVNDIHELLILQENSESRKKLISLQNSIEITATDLSNLEALVKHKVIIYPTINKYLNLSNKLKSESEFIGIISNVLQLLSLVGNQKGLLDTVASKLEKYRIWPSLAFEDMVNLMLVYYYSNSSVKLPAGIEENFKLEILKADPIENLSLSLANGLNYYKSFKYTTEFEPRHLVSNDLNLREISPELNIDAELPQKEVSKYMKIAALFNKYEIPTLDEDCKAAIKFYYKQRDKNKAILNLRSDIVSVVNDIVGFKGIMINFIDNQVDEKTHWRIDLSVKGRVGFFFIAEDEVFYNENGEVEGQQLLQNIIRVQLQASLKMPIIPIVLNDWRNFSLEKKKAIINSVIKYIKI